MRTDTFCEFWRPSQSPKPRNTKLTLLCFNLEPAGEYKSKATAMDQKAKRASPDDKADDAVEEATPKRLCTASSVSKNPYAKKPPPIFSSPYAGKRPVAHTNPYSNKRAAIDNVNASPFDANVASATSKSTDDDDDFDSLDEDLLIQVLEQSQAEVSGAAHAPIAQTKSQDEADDAFNELLLAVSNSKPGDSKPAAKVSPHKIQPITFQTPKESKTATNRKVTPSPARTNNQRGSYRQLSFVKSMEATRNALKRSTPRNLSAHFGPRNTLVPTGDELSPEHADDEEVHHTIKRTTESMELYVKQRWPRVALPYLPLQDCIDRLLCANMIPAYFAEAMSEIRRIGCIADLRVNPSISEFNEKRKAYEAAKERFENQTRTSVGAANET